MTPALEINNLTAGYGKHVVVRDISLSLHSGEILAIFGANGAGKSTVLRAIMRTAHIFTGTVYVSGNDVSRLHAHMLAAMGVAAMLQGGRVFPSLTVRENLSVAVRKGPARSLSDAIKHVVKEFPELIPHLDKPAAFLSGGERQILGVCRALVASPSVLILDEPGAGLADSTLASVLQRVQRRVREGDMALLLVEQNASIGLQAADSAAVLRDGQMVFKGDARTIAVTELAELMLRVETRQA